MPRYFPTKVVVLPHAKNPLGPTLRLASIILSRHKKTWISHTSAVRELKGNVGVFLRSFNRGHITL